jgi:hypothetical protein
VCVVVVSIGVVVVVSVVVVVVVDVLVEVELLVVVVVVVVGGLHFVVAPENIKLRSHVVGSSLLIGTGELVVPEYARPLVQCRPMVNFIVAFFSTTANTVRFRTSMATLSQPTLSHWPCVGQLLIGDKKYFITRFTHWSFPLAHRLLSTLLPALSGPEPEVKYCHLSHSCVAYASATSNGNLVHLSELVVDFK